MKTKLEIITLHYHRYYFLYNLYKNNKICEIDLMITTGLTPEEIKTYLKEINKNTDVKEVV